MEDQSNDPMGQLSAHLDRGWDLVTRGDFAGAMLSAEKSLEVDDASPEAHNLMGYIFQAEGRAEEALTSYRAALDLEEGYVEAMLNAAEVLVYPLKDLDGALQMVREALDWLEPVEIDERADAMLLEIDILMMRGDREAAAKIVRDLPAGPYDNPSIGLSIGRARLDVGDVEGALPLIREACEQELPHADALYYLGLALEVTKEATGALVAFLRSREIDSQAASPPWSISLPQFERRVRGALSQLPLDVSTLLEGALVVVTDLPGAEVVAEGVDPRMPVLLDALSEPGEAPRIGRVFVYKRNVERLAPGLFELDAEFVRSLTAEVRATFPATETGGTTTAIEGDLEP